MTLLVCRVGGGLASFTTVAVQRLLVCMTPWINGLDSCINQHSFTAYYFILFLFYLFVFVLFLAVFYPPLLLHPLSLIHI